MTIPIGAVVDGTEVRDAVKDILIAWLPWYLAERCAAHGLARDALKPPVSWQVLPDLEAAKPDQFPAGIVMSPGLAGPPRQDDDGKVSASWLVNVLFLVRGQNYDEVARNVGIYAGAVRAAVAQHPSLDGFASGTTWRNESYDLLDGRVGRTLGGATVEFAVDVADVLDVFRGPLSDPPADPTVPPVDDPDAASVTVIESALPHPALE